MNKIVIILILIWGLNFLVSVTAKDYTRSCDCSLSWGVETANGHRVDSDADPTLYGTYSFSGQGTVSWYHPSEARRRARHNIDECIQAAWGNRNGVYSPSECTEANQIFRYPFRSGLITYITNRVCSAHPDYDWFTVGLAATFDGDRGCLLDNNNWGTSIASYYPVQCPDWTDDIPY
jgi:hypothetical protein